MNGRIKIMVVEDDEILAEQIVLFLQKWGYEARTAQTFDDILAAFTKICPQLVLLDINLPCYDGFYWCRQIRTVSDVPVIFISSRDDDGDKIMAIAQGGDDYIEKPFHLEILRAKVEAVIRRAYQYQVRDRIYISCGKSQQDIYFEPDGFSLFIRGQEVELTRSERQIMAKLLENRNNIVTRDDLMTVLWNTDEFVSDGTLTTLISRLRNKLSAACGEGVIKTKKGQGYYIE